MESCVISTKNQLMFSEKGEGNHAKVTVNSKFTSYLNGLSGLRNYHHRNLIPWRIRIKPIHGRHSKHKHRSIPSCQTFSHHNRSFLISSSKQNLDDNTKQKHQNIRLLIKTNQNRIHKSTCLSSHRSSK